MGCFFGCFGIKESRSIPVSSPEPAVSRSKNALSSLFSSDDETLLKGEEGPNPVLRQLNVKELRDEVKFDKKTEIRKDFNGIPAQNREEKSSKLSLLFSNASSDEWKQEKQSDGSSVSVKNHEDCVNGSGSPSSCMTDRHSTGRISSPSNQRSSHNNAANSNLHGSEIRSEISSISSLPFTPNVKPPTKSVNFTSEANRSGFSSEGSSSECVSYCSKQSGFTGDKIVPKPCPYPTPQKLTDEMQTPGTEFPVCLHRSQYAYSVSKNHSDLEDKCSSDSFRESPDEENLIATPMLGPTAKHLSVGKETDHEGSLSSWFKPVSIKQDGPNKHLNSISAEKVGTKTPGDRPIIGMVAAYWNEDEAEPHIPPKWWDGNGIPNSTNKYKEDQTVSWHATPFEERLEKALSEETSVTQRKPISSTPPVDFNETEESDTALSRLQSSNHTKPVVSF